MRFSCLSHVLGWFRLLDHGRNHLPIKLGEGTSVVKQKPPFVTHVSCRTSTGTKGQLTVHSLHHEGIEICGPDGAVVAQLAPLEMGRLRAALRDAIYAAFPTGAEGRSSSA
jgi:hypothetical protein